MGGVAITKDMAYPWAFICATVYLEASDLLYSPLQRFCNNGVMKFQRGHSILKGVIDELVSNMHELTHTQVYSGVCKYEP